MGTGYGRERRPVAGRAVSAPAGLDPLGLLSALVLDAGALWGPRQGRAASLGRVRVVLRVAHGQRGPVVLEPEVQADHVAVPRVRRQRAVEGDAGRQVLGRGEPVLRGSPAVQV